MLIKSNDREHEPPRVVEQGVRQGQASKRPSVQICWSEHTVHVIILYTWRNVLPQSTMMSHDAIAASPPVPIWYVIVLEEPYATVQKLLET